jgi:hypothetical protein
MDNKRVEQPLSPDEVKELKKLITEKTAQIVNGNRRRSMPCDSPEQIKQLFGEWVTAETFEYAPEIEAAIEVFQSHASQQCASLREENEKLKVQASNYAYQMEMAKRERDKAESDNDRLREIVKEIFRLPENEEYHERFQLSAKGRDLYKALQSNT